MREVEGGEGQRVDSKVEKETAEIVEHQRKAPSSQVRTTTAFQPLPLSLNKAANNSGAYPCCRQISSHLFMHVSDFRLSALMQDRDY